PPTRQHPPVAAAGTGHTAPGRLPQPRQQHIRPRPSGNSGPAPPTRGTAHQPPHHTTATDPTSPRHLPSPHPTHQRPAHRPHHHPTTHHTPPPRPRRCHHQQAATHPTTKLGRHDTAADGHHRRDPRPRTHPRHDRARHRASG